MKNDLKNQVVRYFALAVVLVGTELLIFLLLNSLLKINYLVSTVLSMLIVIVLNWYFSKVFVFKVSVHAPTKEFTLVLLASLVGMGIQSLVIYFCVESLHFIPVLGKMAAIGITFVWNFWVRRVYIFNEKLKVN